MLLPLLLASALAGPASLPVIGGPARQFILPAINEQAALRVVDRDRVALNDLVGVMPGHPAQGVILYFFTREDGGDSLADIDHLAGRYDRKGIRFLAISVDQGDLGALSDWLQGLRLDVPVLRDNHRIVAARYQVQKLPAAFVIDANGDILSAGLPSGPELVSEIETAIAPLLAR